MKKLITGIVFIGLSTFYVFGQNELPEKFVNFMERTQMSYIMPKNFESVEPIVNKHMRYELCYQT